MTMSMTSSRRMSNHNRKRALIRIAKELQYVLRKMPDDAPGRREVQCAVFHVNQALQAESGDRPSRVCLL